MARDNTPFTPEEDISPAPRQGRGAARANLEDDPLDSRTIDLDNEDEAAFRRAPKRVPAKRGPLPRKVLARLKWVVLAAIIFCFAYGAWAAVERYGTRSWRFRINSSDDLEIAGTHNVTRPQIMQVMGGDIGRNVFFIPLAERKKQLEQIAWVESATVMRFLPDRIRIEIKERTPVAFVHMGSRIQLIDGNGVIMEMPPGQAKKYSFPVLTGMNDNEPLSTRAARMMIFTRLISDLDRDGANYSKDLSEIDLNDPDDAKVTVADPAGPVVIHLGDANFLERYKIYTAHVGEWRQQFQRLDSVDLRYERQVIVNPDAPRNAPKQLAQPVIKKVAATKVVAKAPTKKPIAKKSAARPAAKTATTKPKAVAKPALKSVAKKPASR